MTASSSSSLQTPRDDESRERMEAAITQSNSVKSRFSRFGKLAHIRHHSEDLGIVHEIPESPEPVVAESRTWNPNMERDAAADSPTPEEFGEKRKRRRMSTGFFQPIKRNSGSIRSSSKSTNSSMWSAFASDFSLKPLDGGKSRSSTLAVSNPECTYSSVPDLISFQASRTSADENKELPPTQQQRTNQSKITRSKSVIASLGFKMTRRTAQPTNLPSPPPSPMRRPTFTIVENREILMQEVRGIEDDESRRLTEMAFMDF